MRDAADLKHGVGQNITGLPVRREMSPFGRERVFE